MAVRLRMKRLGRKNLKCFRICAFDSRVKRDGREIEVLGFYDPVAPEGPKQLQLKRDRIIHWLDVGAQPSESVACILKKNGIHPKPGRKPKKEEA